MKQNWRVSIKESIRRILHGRKPEMPDAILDAESERRFQRLMQMEVPSDAELMATKDSGRVHVGGGMMRF